MHCKEVEEIFVFLSLTYSKFCYDFFLAKLMNTKWFLLILILVSRKSSTNSFFLQYILYKCFEHIFLLPKIALELP